MGGKPEEKRAGSLPGVHNPLLTLLRHFPLGKAMSAAEG
jgi:hypothetical protein